MNNNENLEGRFCSLYEYMRDKTEDTQTISKQSGYSFYLEPPIASDNEPVVWDDFEWEVIEPKIKEPLPIALVSKSYGRKTSDQPLNTYRLDFFNFSSEAVKLKVVGKAKRFRFTVYGETPSNLYKEVANMEQYTNNNSSLVMTSDNLNLLPGQVDYKDIKSPNGKPIQEVFFFDSTEDNKRTALTGKQFISDVTWRLTFHNADPKLPVELRFFVLTKPF